MTQFCAKIAIIGQPNVGKSTYSMRLQARTLPLPRPKYKPQKQHYWAL